MENLVKFLSENKIEYQEKLPLKDYSTMHVGGIADIAIFPSSSEELLLVHKKLKILGIQMIIIGNGSKVIFNDEGFHGAVLFTKKMKSCIFQKDLIECDCGMNLEDLVSFASDNNLSGSEFLFGIPGTVGGGIYMNCGAFGRSISEITENVTFLDNEKVLTFERKQLKFSFRRSIFTDSEKIILKACFHLNQGNINIIKQSIETYKQKRALQPIDLPSSGSIFLPHGDTPAWELIDGAGLRGKVVGGAKVSETHAGFIVNSNNATAQDIKQLILLIQNEVYKKYKINLQTEVIFAGE